MKRFGDLGGTVALIFILTSQVHAQEGSVPQEACPLALTEAFALEGIKGRFDHFGTSGRKLFISAFGNNTVEVIDVSGASSMVEVLAEEKRQQVDFEGDANLAVSVDRLILRQAIVNLLYNAINYSP